MKTNQRRTPSFITVLPIVVLTSCANSAIKTSNPPEPPTNPPVEPTPLTNSPTPDAPKVGAFSVREKRPDGTCYVSVFANPPFERSVSCTAPIEPAPAGEQWCKVEDAKDPSKKAPVDCASK